MEKNKEQQDVIINVTGVSMSGETDLNEHNRITKPDKEVSAKVKKVVGILKYPSTALAHISGTNTEPPAVDPYVALISTPA